MVDIFLALGTLGVETGICVCECRKVQATSASEQTYHKVARGNCDDKEEWIEQRHRDDQAVTGEVTRACSEWNHQQQ